MGLVKHGPFTEVQLHVSRAFGTTKQWSIYRGGRVIEVVALGAFTLHVLFGCYCEYQHH